MSYERVVKAINLEKTDKIPQMEFLHHPELVAKITGMDPYEFPLEAFVEAYRMLDIDLVLEFPYVAATRFEEGEVIVDEKGKLRTQWGLDCGAHWESDSPFHDVEEVLAYDPFTRGGKPDWARFLIVDPKRSVEEMAEAFAAQLEERQALFGESALIPAIHVCTLFHYFVTTFGWELTFEAAMLHPKRFKCLIERFALLSIKIAQAWALIDVPLFFSHDDIAMKTGPIFSPDWYRENIFPWYKEIWKSLSKSGKKVLFMSDGNITSLADDVIACGADGLFFEAMVSMEDMVRKYGDSKILVGNVDAAVLTFGDKEDIENEVKRCVTTAGDCPGYVLAVPGSIPQNIPLENVEAYFEFCDQYRMRT